jgi:hypothetical protein
MKLITYNGTSRCSGVGPAQGIGQNQDNFFIKFHQNEGGLKSSKDVQAAHLYENLSMVQYKHSFV